MPDLHFQLQDALVPAQLHEFLTLLAGQAAAQPFVDVGLAMQRRNPDSATPRSSAIGAISF
ncbi:MAG: hypothetical protein ACR2K3_05860 [Nocardioides sp.]